MVEEKEEKTEGWSTHDCLVKEKDRSERARIFVT